MRHLFAQYRPFRWLWWGSTFSMLGGRALSVTYPLLAYTLTGSSEWIGWVVFASTMPGLICYIPAGVLIDRIGPRRVLMSSEAVRFVIMGALVVLLLSDRLRVEWVVVFALVEGGLAVTSSVAESALIPRVVRDDDLDAALAMHETSTHGAVLVGRQLGGLLYGLVPFIPFMINGLMFAGSALSYRTLPREVPDARRLQDVSLRIELRAGFAALWGNRFLRLATFIVACTNLMVQCLIVVFLTIATKDDLSPVWVGSFLAASGVGGVVGGLLWPRRDRISTRIENGTAHNRLARRLVEWMGLARRRSIMLVHVWACTAAIVLILAFGQLAPSFFGALLVIGLAGGLSNVTLRSAWSRVPDDLRGRVVSVSRFVSYSAVAIGPLIGSLLVTWGDTKGATLFLFGSMALLTLTTTLVHLRKGLTRVSIPVGADPVAPSVTASPAPEPVREEQPSVPERALPAVTG
ncbi:MFS transporter [Nonomuraea sp. MCN248]|uniref:MFS transporter n=1 Tax=Nonomuraea corallina TaxID=2989783 RepID=A0ABT4S7N9_9ACTN|nr:MFS transporter [Nonomuraea corallina]MDA0633232.1 MFS transporter [Nonomuraea corallina]